MNEIVLVNFTMVILFAIGCSCLRGQGIQTRKTQSASDRQDSSGPSGSSGSRTPPSWTDAAPQASRGRSRPSCNSLQCPRLFRFPSLGTAQKAGSSQKSSGSRPARWTRRSWRDRGYLVKQSHRSSYLFTKILSVRVGRVSICETTSV